MNPADLRSRLDSIKKQAVEKKQIQPGSKPSGQDSEREIPQSEQSLLDNGWTRIAEMVYEKISISDNPLNDIISDFLLSESADTADLVFYDTETTGLSGGAGNIVFLSGFGFIENDHLKTVQLMLTDFPGEPAFLIEMQRYITPEKIYVSYNGRSFDSNILKTRYAMNGMKLDFGYQLDLLYPARRLWKNVIGSCSLGDIEREVLGKKRKLDVPGSMVPDLYFDFIKRGLYQSIEGVAAHHLEDIQSLAQLLAVFEDIGKIPVDTERVDSCGLASQLLERHPEDAIAVLKAGFKTGSYRAAKALGLLYKKNADFQAAKTVWEDMWETNRNIFAGLELAKHLEHRERDFTKALIITTELLSFENFRIRSILPELKKRETRLEGRIKGCQNNA